LATLFAAGLLTAIEVPDEELERTRALVRCRADLVGNLTQTKHRTTRMLQSRGHVFGKTKNWTLKFRAWLKKVELEGADQIVLTAYIDMIDYLEGQIGALEAQIGREAETERFRATVQVLGAFPGVALVTAMTLACELGDIRRFESPRQLMAFLGLVPSEYSSGNTTRRGSITKTGNTHARRVLVSAAWKYARRPTRSQALKKRQEGASPAVIAIVSKAQHRLHKKFHKLVIRRPRSVAAVAVARELSGFLWAAMNTLTPAAA
jgi:transposase